MIQKINIPDDSGRNCEFTITVGDKTIKCTYSYEAIEKRHYLGIEYGALKIEKMCLVSGGILNASYKNIMPDLLLFVYSPLWNDPVYDESEFQQGTSMLFVADQDGYNEFLKYLDND